jgi:hypothetical protein
MTFHKKRGRFDPLADNLIRARSQKELDVFIAEYTPDFIQVCREHGGSKENSDCVSRKFKR